MSKKEELMKLKDALAALKERIEADDAEAIAEGEKLQSEIATKTAEIAQDEKKAALLTLIGSNKEEEDNNMPEAKRAQTLGDNFVNFVKSANFSKRFTLSAPAFEKAASDPQLSPTGIEAYATTFDRNVVTGPRTALVIRDLFGAETISGNTLVYLVEGAMEGEPAVTAEGAKKAQVHFADPVQKTVTLKKLTEFIKESDEYINDYPFLASAINGRLLYALGLKEQNELVADLLGTSGLQTGSVTGTKQTDIADAILQATADVQEQSGFAADAIVMNPETWYKLRIAKDGQDRYYGGGFFGPQNVPNLWGFPVCVTTAVTASQILVGAFKTCGSVVTKGGVSVEATNSNEDDFVKNFMTIRAEERLALAVRRPAGFKVLTLG